MIRLECVKHDESGVVDIKKEGVGNVAGAEKIG